MRVCVAVVAFFVCLKVADATICVPLSTFKVDCNKCRCSDSGLEYSCTTRVCGQSFAKQDDGYVLLKDGSNDRFNYRNTRRIMIPYINDEIPNSQEENNIKDYHEEDLEETREANKEMEPWEYFRY